MIYFAHSGCKYAKLECTDDRYLIYVIYRVNVTSSFMGRNNA